MTTETTTPTEALDTRALKKKAEKATPGPWKRLSDEMDGNDHDDDARVVMVEPGAPFGEVVICEQFHQDEPNAEFIAAASPDVILALLSERDTAHARIAALEQALGDVLSRWAPLEIINAVDDDMGTGKRPCGPNGRITIADVRGWHATLAPPTPTQEPG